ncbi:MAG: hypothetical protein GY702_20140 [Desulfobulbaceae bacterium]|nr:hypothetical protein [Desulfobulbaceae bacterium]
MRSPNDLWAAIGDIDEEETRNVLTKLFVIYEQAIERDPTSIEATLFFKNLDLAMTQTEECNLNRR